MIEFEQDVRSVFFQVAVLLVLPLEEKKKDRKLES